MERCSEFVVLITIPFYEWNEVEGRRGEEEYIKRKVMGE